MKNRLFLAALCSSILLVIAFCAYGIVDQGRAEDFASVSVILNDSSSERWNALKEGLEQGAEEFGIHLNVVSTGKLSSTKEEYEILQRELEQGADGVLLEPWGEDTDGALRQLTETKHCILLESDMTRDELSSLVQPDPEAIGTALAEDVAEAVTGNAAVAETAKADTAAAEEVAGGTVVTEAATADTTAAEEMTGDTIVTEAAVVDTEIVEEVADTEEDTPRIGILSGNQEQISMQLRLQSFEERLEELGLEAAWSVSAGDLEAAGDAAAWFREHPAEIYVALENDETERAVSWLLEGEAEGTLLYGVGRSEETVYYLDKGLIQELIVPNEYYMGYRSLEILSEQIDYYTSQVVREQIDFLKVTRENLYDGDISRIVFPTVS